MRYATWKLNFKDPNYGTGPEQAIADNGFHAEGAWASGNVEDGSTIMGYVSGDASTSGLSPWSFQYISQEEALEIALAINPEAYLLEDGRITAPLEI